VDLVWIVNRYLDDLLLAVDGERQPRSSNRLDVLVPVVDQRDPVAGQSQRSSGCRADRAGADDQYLAH
jgi:hypothetical protein